MIKNLCRVLALAGALCAGGLYAQSPSPVSAPGPESVKMVESLKGSTPDPFQGSPYLKCVRESMKRPRIAIDDLLGSKENSLTRIVSDPMVREAAKDHFERLMSMAFRRVTHQLSASDSFYDTRRPNAVVIFPMADDSKTFSSPSAIAWFSSVWKRYDVYVKVAEDVGDVYDALDRVPDISLVVLSGHGRRSSIAFDDAPDDARGAARWVKVVAAEKTYACDLTPRDRGLAHHLKNLRPGVVFFLNSCSTGKRGKSGQSMADFIGGILHRHVPFKRGVYTVIAPSEDLVEEGIDIKSLYPFEVRLMEGRRDITYVNQGDVYRGKRK